MIQTCCKNHKPKQLRQRYNPTFVHQPIFNNGETQNIHIRYTPTFCSTALNTQGYNISTIHTKNQVVRNKPNENVQKITYTNFSHQRRIQDLNPGSQVFYSSKQKWFDHNKQRLIHGIKDGNNLAYSRSRKFIDLSSDPVFTNFNYVSNPNDNLAEKKQQVRNQTIVQQINQNLAQQTPALVQEVKPSNPEQVVKQAQKKPQLRKTVQKQSKEVKDNKKNGIPSQQLIKTKKDGSVNKRPQTAKKVKIVAENPKFIVVRGNKIQNKL